MQEVDGMGVASNSCTPARDHASTDDKGTHGVGGSCPPPGVPLECRRVPPAQTATITAVKPSKSFHITAVLKRKSRYDELMIRPSKFERTQVSASGACSANPVEGRGSPQTPPDTEVAYCTKPDCNDSNCNNCYATINQLSEMLGVRPPESGELEKQHNRKRTRIADEFKDGDAHPNRESYRYILH